ncbi:MAG: hypothetical protein R3223_05370 [Longimicrobiales bacterium]|nr:hypothetical protein [Longimicrobiales bacterium]
MTSITIPSKSPVRIPGLPSSDLGPLRDRASRLWTVALAVVLLALLPGAGELAAQDVDVSGTWNMTVQSQQGTTNPSVTLRQDGQSLTGRYSSETLGDAEVTGSVNGNEITFSFTANMGGQSIPATYTATVEGDEMSGDLTLAGQALASFTATRADG